jgi:hypothetical protein
MPKDQTSNGSPSFNHAWFLWDHLQPRSADIGVSLDASSYVLPISPPLLC